MLLTIAIATYNRADSLARTLEALLRQRIPDNLTIEILVCDNNSKDETRAVVEQFQGRNASVRYCFQARQGLSPARNMLLAESRGEWLAWTDDDIEPEPDWITNMLAAIHAHPDCALFGGKVLAMRDTRFPPWLDRAHHSPLALLDRGDQSHLLSTQNGFVVGANMIANTAKSRQVGAFSEQLGRVGHRLLGSMEDEDFVQRLLDAGFYCLYRPELVVRTEVQSDRLRCKYHWRWHFGHGHHWAVRRYPPFERSHRSLFGVPGHVYRQALVNLLKLPLAITSGSAIMMRLNLIIWSAGFIRERLRQNREQRGQWWRGAAQPEPRN